MKTDFQDSNHVSDHKKAGKSDLFLDIVLQPNGSIYLANACAAFTLSRCHYAAFRVVLQQDFKAEREIHHGKYFRANETLSCNVLFILWRKLWLNAT